MLLESEIEQLRREAKRNDDWHDQVIKTIRKFIAGERLSEDGTYVERILAEFQAQEREGEVVRLTSTSSEMPPLTLSTGSSGFQLSAPFPAPFENIDEYTGKNLPQCVFISMWHQFPNAAKDEHREKLGIEIARRAMAHDALVEQLKHQEAVIESWREGADRRDKELNRIIEMWRTERVAAGKPEDFSDFK